MTGYLMVIGVIFKAEGQRIDQKFHEQLFAATLEKRKPLSVSAIQRTAI